MKKTAILFVLLALVSAAGWSQQTGEQLHAQWVEYQKIQLGNDPSANLFLGGLFFGYVKGILQMGQLSHYHAFSVPDGVSYTQACAVVGKYLDAHPEEWNEIDLLLVTEALTQAWPTARQ